MAQGVNRYRADLRDIRFLLFEQLQIAQLLVEEPFAGWGIDEVQMVLDEVYRYARDISGPVDRVGDQQGCRLQQGRVEAPEGFARAYRAVYEQGWKTLDVPSEFGGQDAPFTLQLASDELITGSNLSLAMYFSLTHGAADLIRSFGTVAQQATYCRRMFHGDWAGTMCLTEAHAGTDVGDATTSATRAPDGSYRIKGTKVFISGGDHDLADNIVHMVLARVDGAPPGSKGLSLFIVPAVHSAEDGSLQSRNDVETVSIEHKMGINGSATCVLEFGAEDHCVGYLCGSEEQQGIRQMFQMMNGARINVGMCGYAVASSAYLNALDYARERVQGRLSREAKAARVPIIRHADVRRMLLDMKARVEGCRALGLKLASHVDRARVTRGKDDEAHAFHAGQVELLTPLLKSYATDQGFQVCQTAIQSYGGAGYLKDHPAEQHCRDSKILAIYEGTNHVQALDLVGRKLSLAGGRPIRDFMAELSRFVHTQQQHPRLATSIHALGEAGETVGELVGALRDEREQGRLGLNANAILDCLSELAVGQLLLEGAVIAHGASAGLPEGDADGLFYEGKQRAAEYFAQRVLPNVSARARVMRSADRSVLDIPEGAFATV